MAKYRKKPVVVDGYKTNRNHTIQDMPEWVIEAMGEDVIMFPPDLNGIEVLTVDGRMYYAYGYVLIKGVYGEIYGVDPDIFKKTYEVALT